jgi:acyl-CoA thioesterase II
MAGAEALDRATQLDGGGGSYSTSISRAREIWGPNGGYLAALALRAAGLRAEIKRPTSFYCHFLRSPDFDRVELEVEVLREGRRSESLSVRMTQYDKLVLQALVGTTASAPGHEHQQVRAPEIPGPEGLKSMEELFSQRERPPFRFWENIERRPIDQSTTPEPGPAIVREWTRFRPDACFDDPFLDAARSLILLDTYGWPAAYRMYRKNARIAPNLDTSAFFHQSSPDSEWLLVDHECIVAHDGLLGVSGRVWSTDGRLLASGSAQLCCLSATQV